MFSSSGRDAESCTEHDHIQLPLMTGRVLSVHSSSGILSSRSPSQGPKLKRNTNKALNCLSFSCGALLPERQNETSAMKESLAISNIIKRETSSVTDYYEAVKLYLLYSLFYRIE